MNSAKGKIEVIVAATDELKSKVFDLRHEVFVIEQKVNREDEFDEFEDSSTHFIAMDNMEVVGTARWRKTEKGIKLERFAVKESYRGSGVGSALVDAVLTHIQDKEGAGKYLYLHAQLTAIPLYSKYDFQKTGPQFAECDIQHFKMERYS